MTVETLRLGEHTAELILNRPEALNAISTAFAEAITAACATLAEDRSVDVVVITSGSAKAFSVGADLKERAGFSDDQLEAQRPVMRAAFAAVRELPMPTIAAVEGYALGGGCELALAADLIVAGADATFGLPETSVGLVPGGGGTQALPRRVGRARAAELIFTGRRIDAEEAGRIGLADRVVPASSARQQAIDLAVIIGANAPAAVRQAKRALRDGADRPLAEALEIEDEAWRAAAFSPDRREGIAAFVEKRRPEWSR
ncbi:enoyl-CoA hydratase/isomerase family protein [Microlunatus speluncae]|uniref:enoyl-CoA hydratase/isomerase family protein n=1 Tax=Microlunatus speluncae TaxID=2594267 RepID=UPI001266455C|nr:enoyl-CoA hydratase-related protein [Microlunatus speluncae]